MDKVKYPYAPGLSLEQAREAHKQLQSQYAKEIAREKRVNELMGRLSGNIVKK